MTIAGFLSDPPLSPAKDPAFLASAGEGGCMGSGATNSNKNEKDEWAQN
jgi:hypothetical protein